MKNNDEMILLTTNIDSVSKIVKDGGWLFPLVYFYPPANTKKKRKNYGFSHISGERTIEPVQDV